MDTEEITYEQAELFGEYPQLPQWEAIEQEVILDTTEVSSVHPEDDWFV